MKKHFEIMIQWSPTRGFIGDSFVWAEDSDRARIDFINNNKDRLRPFDKVEVWKCRGCEECDEKKT